MGQLGLLICVAAVFLMFRVSTVAGVIALIVALMNLISLGAVVAAKGTIAERDYTLFKWLNPSWDALIAANIVTAIAGLVLLIIGIVKGC